MRLSLLVRFELRLAGRLIDLPNSAQRLLGFLALQGHPVPRARVAGLLWGNSSDQRSGGCLRSSLWRLHRPGYRLVESQCHMLRLASGIDVDAHELARVAHRLIGGSEDPADNVEQLSVPDDLLPDWSDDWVVTERERLRLLRLHALDALVERRLAAGRCGEASDAALSAMLADPLRESAQRALIRVHLAEGNAAEALRQYHRFSALLDRELGVAPSAELYSLVSDLIRNRPYNDSTS
jgi:DNA-binding SARP family transcriptional activator